MEALFSCIDDWNYKYVDVVNLKRFLIKCQVIPNNGLLVAIIRRMDLDADAKLNLREFYDAIRPLENFTVKKFASTKKQRPLTAKQSKSV